jgi:hypothetical protein
MALNATSVAIEALRAAETLQRRWQEVTVTGETPIRRRRIAGWTSTASR